MSVAVSLYNCSLRLSNRFICIFRLRLLRLLRLFLLPAAIGKINVPRPQFRPFVRDDSNRRLSQPIGKMDMVRRGGGGEARRKKGVMIAARLQHKHEQLFSVRETVTGHSCGILTQGDIQAPPPLPPPQPTLLNAYLSANIKPNVDHRHRRRRRRRRRRHPN